MRWKQDYETDPGKRYTNSYEYDTAKTRDVGNGAPEAIKFKCRLESILPFGTRRTQLQIHSAAKKDGTASCVGIQTYADCLFVSAVPQCEHGTP